MSFYFLQLIIFLLYSLFFGFFKSNLLKIYYCFATIHLSIVMGLRAYWVGVDTKMYVNVFLTQNTSFNGNGILVYNFLNKIVWLLTNGNYHIMLFVLSFLTVSLFILSLNELKYDFLNSFLAIYMYITFYYYFESFNIQRQMLAVSFAMFSISQFLKQRNIRGTIYLLLGIGIHSTALLALINLFLIKIGRSKKMLGLTIVFSLILILNIEKFLNIFTSLFNHYDMYTVILENGLMSAAGGTFLLGIFFGVIALITYLLTDVFEEKTFAFTFFATVITSIFYLTGFHSQLLIRIANYFSIFSLGFVPAAIRKISNRFSEGRIICILGFMMVIMVGFSIMYYKLSNNFGGIVPYSTGM